MPFGRLYVDLGIALAHTKHHGVLAAAHLVHELLGHILAQAKKMTNGRIHVSRKLTSGDICSMISLENSAPDS